MNSQQLVERFEAIVDQMKETIRRKNHDYARGEDPFKNLRRHEEYGVVVRMDDKISRLDSFFNPKYERKLAVSDESILDTAKDLANYAILLVILHEDLERQREERKSPVERLYELAEPARTSVGGPCESSVAHAAYDTGHLPDPDINRDTTIAPIQPVHPLAKARFENHKHTPGQVCRGCEDLFEQKTPTTAINFGEQRPETELQRLVKKHGFPPSFPQADGHSEEPL